MSGTVWVTRPGSAAVETVDAVSRAGFQAVSIPVIEVGPVPFEPPPEIPALVVFVSANAVRALEAGMDAAATRRAAEAWCVGEPTARVAEGFGWRTWYPETRQSAEAVVEHARTMSLSDLAIWIPCGDREGTARTLLPGELTALGARVTLLPAYTTRRRGLEAGDYVTLGTHEPAVILVHSPSAAEELHADSHPAVRRWRDTARWLAVGTRTASRLRELGAGDVSVCHEPGATGVTMALQRIRSRTP